MQYHRQAHCVYRTDYHIVFPTKYRRKIFNKGMCGYLKIIIRKITQRYPEIHFLEINTDRDHVHLLVTIPPKMPVSDVVRIIKCNTARILKKRFAFLQKTYSGDDGIWSSGYFVSTVGVDEEIIRRYIQKQGEEDCGQGKLEL